MMPMPPSHWVNCRQITIERSTAGMSVSTLAPVVVKPDMRLEVGVDRARELLLAREQVRKRAEGGGEQPGQRRRRGIPRGSPAWLGAARAPLEAEPGAGRDRAGSQERPEGLAVAERRRPPAATAETLRYLSSVPVRFSAALRSTPEGAANARRSERRSLKAAARLRRRASTR